jgi:hypothetical protein
MEGLSNSVTTVIQLWEPLSLSKPEDGDDTFSETLVRAITTRYKVAEYISNWHHCESNPEVSGIPILVVSLYVEAQ